MRRSDEACFSFADSPQDFCDPTSPPSRDMKTSHEIAVCYRLPLACMLSDIFHDVLQIETISSAVQEVVPKVCELLLYLVAVPQGNPRTNTRSTDLT